MKNNHVLAAGFALAASLTSFADVKVNDNLSVGGFGAGSYRYTSPDPGDFTDKFDIDAMKLGVTGTFKPVTAVVSMYYQPGAPSDISLLDAFATVDIGGGSSITAGKFLSYLGYESFYIDQMNQISYANGDFLGPIPGYHSGVRWDYSDKDISFGLAALDSVYSGPNYLKGDGELKHNAGFEGYFAYKAIKDLTIWAGFAYDTAGNVVHPKDEILTLDLWLSYAIDANSTIAGEYVTKDGGKGDKGYNWLGFYQYTFDKKWSSAFRVGGEKMDNGPGFIKYTVSPTYKVNDNFLARAEVSYYDYSKYTADTALFLGVQMVFKF